MPHDGSLFPWLGPPTASAYDPVGVGAQQAWQHVVVAGMLPKRVVDIVGEVPHVMGTVN